MPKSLPPDAAELLEAVLAARPKYARIEPATRAWAIADALRRERTIDAADKRARATLHQIAAAFADAGALERARAELHAIGPRPFGDPQLRDWCRRTAQLHASTAERLPQLDPFLAFAWPAPPPDTFADLGCGLQPLLLPTMPARMHCLDIDLAALALLADYFRAIAADAECRPTNLLLERTPIRADLVWCLKLLPTLERQQPGAARALLDRIESPVVVLSFPTRSLTGRGKGMAENYERWATQELPAPTARGALSNELLWTVRRDR